MTAPRSTKPASVGRRQSFTPPRNGMMPECRSRNCSLTAEQISRFARSFPDITSGQERSWTAHRSDTHYVSRTSRALETRSKLSNFCEHEGVSSDAVGGTDLGHCSTLLRTQPTQH